ncbi:hypothetical protein [Chromobacterium violaceum]|uniref:Uncharacterized protein n=1 Tax=Chromobacterium violaceum (strain ATCC 12472 / DSM 30191 / JCM 1249 / CCUG 213 / NBRC 12614 / NCIMB 9131 / NCTC 9757 / MK) TaxID=243365 RepID=Q7NUW6_CHRVO|nr:hypothetical protein [Chromobacterium violaceum]AAQ60251.1 hypothetical protein CV_2581 [Chromobacterium violaceum ATCC 12472]SUX35779.1 Uncharacterised protein [Chromobacterium violaceum]
MNEMTQLKSMIDGLKKRRMGFKKQLDDFKALQGEIAALEARAESDPVARGKLQKLEAMMKSGGEQLHQQIVSKVAMAEKTFSQLGKQLKQLAPEDDAKASAMAEPVKAAPVLAKKHRRSFV